MKRWAIINHFIKLNSYKTVIELGVWKGATMTYVLKKNPDLTYYGVDLYSVQPNGSCETYEAGENGHDWDHEAYYNSMMAFCRLHENAYIIKEDTAKVAETFSDETVDLVFVDADHSYEGVKRDIEAWWPKIRKGGMMLGHDYNEELFPGTVKAVDEFFQRKELYDDDVWAVRKG